MKFTNEQLKTTFECPDNPKVRQVLAYDEATLLGAPVRGLYDRLWEGVCTALVTDWQSPIERSPATLNDSASPEAVEVIKWASLALFSWYIDWKERAVPKN